MTVQARAMAWSGLLVLLLLAGCFRSRPCGDRETCDRRDDDCDGAIDEGFIDPETGLYLTANHCGACGVDCAAVFPGAAETACVAGPREGEDDGAGDGEDDAAGPLAARCEVVACPPGTRLEPGAGCLPITPSLCLPCAVDDDCGLREPGAVCSAAVDGEPRCFPSCEGGCPPGTRCVELPSDDGFSAVPACLPIGGDCTCSDATAGARFGCRLDGGAGLRCDGFQECQPGGELTACAPALEETCNGADDDCDGTIDEGFRDEAGRYLLDPIHCGACNAPCAPPGPNTFADCVAAGGAGARCDTGCLPGFVDVDGLAANGCECERLDDGMGPPPAIGGDADCDGVVDDDDDFVHVASTGNDGDPGTLLRPVRTIQRGIALGRAEAKDVLVARGIYDGPILLAPGVGLFGGYRPDFRDRDLELFPVRVERGVAEPGAPVLVAREIRVPTEVDGLTLVGSDAVVPGAGSTAVYLDRSTEALRLSNVTILAGRGQDGRRGEDSSDRLASLGLDELDDLDGPGGGDGGDPGVGCRTVLAGGGGRQRCGGRDVSGGDGGDATCPDTGCRQGRPCANAGCTDFTDPDGRCDLDAVLEAAVPLPSASSGRGPFPGEAGERTYPSPTNRGTCNFCDDNPTLRRLGGDGTDGGDGLPGEGGDGCGGSDPGGRVVVDLGRGLVAGRNGNDGTSGTDGSGGGGGTPGAGYAVIDDTVGACVDRNGGSGGGGGAGGCGAPGAGAGGGGGASLAILVRLAPGALRGPALDQVRVVTGSGGRGGDGGVGAAGGAGGSGGVGGSASFFCARDGGSGGDGGDGGGAGGGGGGCGGGSHAVFLARGAAGDDVGAYVDALEDALLVEAVGVPGRGGAGGPSPASPGGDGRDGSGQALLVR
jgi:hypothetical protein